MTVFGGHEKDFDPASGTAICYKPMEREKLESWLGERNLLGHFPKRLVDTRVLDALYARIEEEREKYRKGEGPKLVSQLTQAI